MKVCMIFAFVLAAVAQTADAPKPHPFTPQDQAAIASLNTRAAALEQEARAIAAERRVLQLEADKLFDAACRAAGGTKCQADTHDQDPARWSFVIVDPPTKPK